MDKCKHLSFGEGLRWALSFHFLCFDWQLQVDLYQENCLSCLNPFPKQALVFMRLQYKSFENTVRKGEIALKEQFLFFFPF